VAAAAVMLAAVTELRAAPPDTLTVGGTVQQAADGTSPSGVVWRAYAAGESGEQVGGAVSAALPDLWTGDIGAKVSSLAVGTDCVAVVSHETGAGTLGHTGYYAVVNHILTGDDPAEFPEMTLRQIPIPAVTSAVLAHLTWDVAVEDPGEAGETNVIGYTVSRSADGINFTLVSTSLLTDPQFDDAIPNDAEYTYALGLVFRGDPPVTGAVLSANSARTFKNTDGDGLPDYFKIANDLVIGSANPDDGPDGDPDNDGMSNYEHWISGTRANDPTSYLFVREPLPSGEGMVIRWDGVAGRRYTLYRKTDLLDPEWTPILGPVSCSSDQIMEHTDSPGESAQRFYRLKVSKD
jgi:hypothetical protein